MLQPDLRYPQSVFGRRHTCPAHQSKVWRHPKRNASRPHPISVVTMPPPNNESETIMVQRERNVMPYSDAGLFHARKNGGTQLFTYPRVRVRTNARPPIRIAPKNAENLPRLPRRLCIWASSPHGRTETNARVNRWQRRTFTTPNRSVAHGFSPAFVLPISPSSTGWNAGAALPSARSPKPLNIRPPATLPHRARRLGTPARPPQRP